MPMRNRLPFMSTSQGGEPWPGELDALPPQQCLKRSEKLRTVPDGSRRKFSFETEGRQDSGGLPHVPFDGVKAEGAVGDVRDAEVLPARQQVLDAHRDHGAQRDLEGPAAEVE